MDWEDVSRFEYCLELKRLKRFNNEKNRFRAFKLKKLKSLCLSFVVELSTARYECTIDDIEERNEALEHDLLNW